MPYVFYDVETTGLDIFFDQIISIHAVQTDDNLNPIDELDLSCRLHPYVIPSPNALAINGISISQLLDASLPDYCQLAQQVHETFRRWTPSLFIGWNSLRFDESLLRQMFYQNLLFMYVTNTNKNNRSDLMRIYQGIHAINPGAIKIPVKEDGKPSFALHAVAEANDVVSTKPHTARSDVATTIGLAKIAMECAPETWSSVMQFSQKQTIETFLAQEPIFFAHVRDCGPQGRVGLFTSLGQLPDRYNEYLLYDLAVSPDELAHAARTGRPPDPNPLSVIKSNESPLIGLAEDLEFHDFAGTLPPYDLAQANREMLDASPGLVDSLKRHALKQTISFEPSPDVEMQLYDGFFPKFDIPIMDRFHSAAWADRYGLAHQFTDQRLRDLSLRLIHAHHPEVLPVEVRAEMDAQLNERHRHGPNRRSRTIQCALSECVETHSSGTSARADVCRYLESL
ncbi:MAG: hypothetical protein H6981_06200 [Gammaproteobacteria bacterium]|nr:hypothetical protein [Gammaproteobacteria bacterium]MCP5136375.1 hypothetical protein [Gammaproteobacteria bacterium]